MRTDGQTDTDMTDLVVSFRNFAEPPENYCVLKDIFY
jgi:hypothetical protein